MKLLLAWLLLLFVAAPPALAQTALPASRGEIPLAMNTLVLKWLNYFVGTEKGQHFVEASITRMPIYRPMIEQALERYKMPREILAVPFIESGFENRKEPEWIGVGLWGFTKGTGIAYGLVVNDTTDERMDEERATDAALRLLTDLNNEFQDWRLALKGYNEGSYQVEKLIQELGTRDPWAIEMAAEGKEQYLSKFTAIAYILKSRDLL